ncbi:MAG: sulfate adenylyltransferase subunit CysN [Rhizobiaceae bacterium]|nr:sulfate adenylyltransferase subunit CysN [Rhizobiaceae bacterium]
MADQNALIESDINAYLDQHQTKTMLRFITCGSVDDGKSTLIGRLLYESKLVFEDQLAALEIDSKKLGTQGNNLDFALLVDGLASEREQGITIDVAYRYFSTEKRKFIVADTPGHEQYTRNMATGASTADLAIILIDARHGVQTQTRRHSYIASLLGIKKIVLAINKMDLVDYSKEVFDNIVNDYQEFAKSLAEKTGNDPSIKPIPLSALIGDNITKSSENMPWYDGPTLIDYLETVEVEDEDLDRPFRMPVQWVNRPNLNFRGFSGLISSGNIKPGDAIKVLPPAKTSTIKSIVTMDGDLAQAIAGQSVTLTLEDEIDISRGDLICAAQSPSEAANQFETTILWMADESMLAGRSYILKSGAQTATATITAPKYKINVNTLEELAARKLELNEIAVCNIALDKSIAFDPYTENRDTGGFILIDRYTNTTVGVGMINFALRRASNIHWQSVDTDKNARAKLMGQKPAILWFTGLSGSGKSTIANFVEKKLTALGRHTYLLDGDNVRHGLNKDLGFTDADRVENIRRIGEVSKLMVDAGLITLVSFISPFRSERRMARELVEKDEFFEIYVDTPLEVAEERDVKGLYKKARAGELKNFTGIDSPYEEPENPEMRVQTTTLSAEEAADFIIERLNESGIIDID